MPTLDQVQCGMLESQEKEQTGALDLQAHSRMEDIDMSQIAIK